MQHELHVLGIDLAKRVFHAVGMDNTGNVVYRKRLSRHDLMPLIAKLPPVRIGIEACGGAHYWARRFRAYGHEVKLMAPQFVKPYVKSNKNDSRDAEAIAEAVTRPTMRFVPIKDVDQQDIQALHRVRERLIGERTALVNEVHGLMHEYGIVIPKGVAKFRQAVVGKLEAEKDKLTPLSQEMFWKLVEEFAALEAQLAYYQEKLEALAATHPECQRLMTIPGIGPLTATALVAAVSDASAFKNGRQFAPGWGWCHANIRQEGRSASWVLVNGAIAISANSSSMERGRRSAGWDARRIAVVNGFASWSSAVAKTARRSQSQTKMPALSGRS
jgi:transposase